MYKPSMAEHIGIKMEEIGEDYLIASMPVENKTHQPHGVLHGGASVALAETVGSIAANLVLDLDTQYAVGLDINANHVRAVASGKVFATGKAIHIGRSTQVWSIEIRNEEGKMVCISRITMAVVDKR